jgi:hypothetical protein
MLEIERKRYYDVQCVDMYTFNYGYIGSCTTGNGECYMVADQDWNGHDLGDTTSRASTFQGRINLLVRSRRDVNTPWGLIEWPNAMQGQVSLEDS